MRQFDGGADADTGAQRLSASTNQTRVCRTSGLGGVCGAQRLSASTNQTRCSLNCNCFAALMCSTPFGINESNTTIGATSLENPLGAQRLSASTNQTPAIGGQKCSPCSRCSTPFGINESNTMFHQGQSFKPSGAQRLSASTNQTLRNWLNSKVYRSVLNAFRHQRIKHRQTCRSD